ncbi:hypothetical protein V9T40_001309 [Parthenolecanium corni]|uniref:Uncharacterized protein n=1 Tax=Parthenolecanium corni TaxID=536013 RepID=A0AAN9TBB9_9HEMI
MAGAGQNTIRIKRFDGTHYLAWRNRVYTELLCEELTELVDKRPTDDLKKKNFGTEKKPVTWGQADARARRIIVENLEDSILHYAPTDICAYEIWKRLKTTYNRSSYLQHAYLRRKLSNLLYDGKSDLFNFFREFDDIIAEIRSSGGKVGKVEDIEAVVILLAALPSDYSAVIASFGEINENNLLALETVKGALLDYDLKRKDERKIKKIEVAEKSSAAFYSNSSPEADYCADGKQVNRSKAEKVFCTYCGREGHRENRCFKKRNENKSAGDKKPISEANLTSGGGAPRTVAFLAENCQDRVTKGKNIISVEVVFVADSGCTKFMVNDLSSFSACRQLEPAVPITLADSSSTSATHIGTVDLITNLGRRIKFTDVLFVPELRRNLLSVRRITLQDYNVVFKKDSVEISTDGDKLASGYVNNELYYVDFFICSSEAVQSEAGLAYVQLHRRLGHLNLAAIQSMKKNGLVNFQGDIPETCEPCIRGKQCQLPYPRSNIKMTRPLEQIVSDVCSADKTSYDGYAYFVTFLDVYTHFSAVYLLKHKSEVFSKFVEYEAMVSAQFGTKIGSFLCDNGREFINSDVRDFCKKKGIRMLNSVAYNHPSNGRAERLNRTLEDKAGTLLLESGMPKGFWSEAVLCANYLLNRCPTSSTGRVPAAEWYQQEVDYEKLRPFGCVCFVHIPKEKRHKFESHSSKGVMVGYAPIGYRIYNLESKKLQIARNIIFDEGKFYKDLYPAEFVVERNCSEPDDSSDDENCADGDDVSETSSPSQSPPLRRSSRDKKLPPRFDDYEVTIGYCEAMLVENPADPKWDEPKRAEMNCLHKFNVWDLVPRQPSMKVIRSKWALQEKPDKLKARLVAVGCDEKDAPSLLFSPVVNMTTVKILLSTVVQKGILLHQMDVSSAFLHGNLDYDVFMEQPPGFCKDKQLVCKLRKAIYGLKVSSRIWNKCINDFMVNSLNFTRSANDFCLYSKCIDKSYIYVLIYVDDLLIASDSDVLISTFKSKIASRFNIVDLGKIKRFLGMEINYNEKSKVMTLSQGDFISKVAKKFNVENCKPVYTPIEHDLNLVRAKEINVNLPYRQLVGCLLYISIITRPDVAFAVNYFSRFMNSYSDEHFKYLKRVLVYLFHTKELKLTYTFSEKILACFVDADWASDKLDRKSVSGNVVTLFDNVISWSSKKQTCIALSSTESEYISLSTFIHDSLFWLLAILSDFNIRVQQPVVIFEDNQSVICLSENPITSKRSKHIDVRFKYVKEMVLDQEIKLTYLPSNRQLADGFTKGLTRVNFEAFRAMLHVL